MPIGRGPAHVGTGPAEVAGSGWSPSRRWWPRRGSRRRPRGVTLGSLSAIEVTTSATMPIGRLMRKIHSQPRWSVNRPPSSGPATEETPKTAPKQALVAAALPRRDDVADDGERERHQAAAAEALDGADRRSSRRCSGEGTDTGADQEDHDRGLEDRPAAAEVGDLAPQRGGRGRGEQVGGDDPGQLVRPPSSEVILGSATPTMLWSSAARNMPAIRPPITTRIWRWLR